jgi:hypothetical protein
MFGLFVLESFSFVGIIVSTIEAGIAIVIFDNLIIWTCFILPFSQR